MFVQVQLRNIASTDFNARLLARMVVSEAARIAESDVQLNRAPLDEVGLNLDFEMPGDVFACHELRKKLSYALCGLPEFGESTEVEVLGFDEWQDEFIVVSSEEGVDASFYKDSAELFMNWLDGGSEDVDSHVFKLMMAFPHLEEALDEYCQHAI